MDLTRYLDVPDALLQQQFPGVDIAQLKEQIRNMGKSEPSSKPVTQTIKIDPATGEQEVTIKGSAQALSAANPLTPTVVQPVVPQAYNQFTAQMESGARPDIGYHDQSRSTAYGKYGITAPQYQEIQRQAPQFANRPITSLSQQEQDAANMASRDVYARQLAAKGIDPTEENIRMAHLLGAGGTRQYLNTGTFNQAAIDANRGEENLRRMVEQRRAGPVAPVAPGQPQARPQTMIAGTPSSDVGLTPTEQAIANQARTPGFNPAEPAPTWMDMTIANQNDPKKLYAMVGDPNLPPELQDAAKQRALSFDQQQQEQIRANEMLQGFAQGKPKETSDILKAIRQKGEEGSYVKAVLFSQLGLNDLAKGEMAKLSSGKFDKAIVDGKSYLTETKMGAVVRAWDPSGAAVDENTLVKLNTEPTDLRIHSTQQMYDPATRQYVTKQELSNGTQRFIAGGRTYAGNVNNLVPAEQFVAQENRRVNSAYSNLSKLTAKPTDEQRFMALRQAGVSPDRIEEELGYPAGTLTRRQAPQTPGVVPTGPTAPVAQQPRGPVAPVAPGAPAPVAQAPQLTRPQPQPQPAGAAPIAVAQAEKYEPPVQKPGEENTTFAKRQAEYDRFIKSKQTIAEKFVDNAPKIQQSLANIRQGYDAVVNNQVNLGPSLGTGGAGPLPKVQQFFGEMVGTDESANTTLVRSLMNRQGLEGLKQSMGPQISNFDVQTWMSNNPIKENSPPEKIAEYLQKLHDELYRVAEQSKVNAVRLGYMDDSFDLGAPIKREGPNKPAEGKSTNKPQGKGTKNDPIKLD